MQLCNGRILLALIALTCVSASLPSYAVADEPKPEESKNGAEEESKEKKSKKPPKEDRFFAIKCGTLHTMAAGTLRDVTVLAKNGKIVAIGTNVAIPEKAEVLDAGAFTVYPGLVAIASGGLLGADPPDDTTNVFSIQMKIALAGGITTAIGQNTAAKLSYGRTDEMIVKRDVFESLKYSTDTPDERRSLRAKFEKVRQYLRDVEAYEEAKKTDPDAEKPDDEWIKGKFKSCLRLLKGEAVADMTAGSANEIAGAIELAERYGIKVVVRGAHEAWTMAPAVARAGISAIVTPRRTIPADDRLNRPNGSSIENAAILYGHGVPIAIVPSITAVTLWGLAGRDLLHLNMAAAFAVRGGLSEEGAIDAITIGAARVAGIHHRVGSVEIGKDADFVVLDGDLLHYMTHARWTVVNGRIVYDKQSDSLFDHIRPDGDLDAPPPDDYWPRSLTSP